MIKPDIKGTLNPGAGRTSFEYSSIQLFRLLAALMVIICHSSFSAYERLTKGSFTFTQGGNGVDLFFVISGFVMIVSSEHLIDVKGGWKIFAYKRIARIVPVYWIFTTLKLLILIKASAFVFHSHFDAWLTLKSYFFIPALNIDGEFRPLYGVGWTLNFEMFFYLLFAVALALKIKPILFLSFLFIPLALLSLYKTYNWPDIGFYANPRILTFLYGMLAAKLILKGYKLPQNIAIILIVFGLLYLFFPTGTAFTVPYQDNKFIIGITAVLIVYSGASIDGLIKTRMSAWLISMGAISYSLYLIHPTVAPLVPTLLSRFGFIHPVISIILSVLLVFISGAVFYRYCENPITKLLKKKVKNPVAIGYESTH